MTDDHLVGRLYYTRQWRSMIFTTLPDGRTYLHDGSRATPKLG